MPSGFRIFAAVFVWKASGLTGHEQAGLLTRDISQPTREDSSCVVWGQLCAASLVTGGGVSPSSSRVQD